MSVAKRDYYEILSVSRDCDEQTLKTSYRKLALQYHPDRNPDNRDAEERFKEAAEAYAVLSDAQKRAAYDRFGHQGVNGAGAAGLRRNYLRRFRRHPGRSFRSRRHLRAAPWRRPLPRAARRRYSLRPRNHLRRFDARLSADVQIPRMEACTRCQGTGAEPKGLDHLHRVQGRGEVVYQQSFLSIRKTCPSCGGRANSCARPAGNAVARAITGSRRS